ncbi:hypothetical protein KIL84_016284, partial [Mauremys mutica]
TSDLQCAFIQQVIEKNSLSDKIVEIYADNTNINFGGARHCGKNNLWQKLQANLGKEIFSIGSGAHIVHNCLQNAVNCLPLDAESFAVKVYKYFRIYM